MQESFPHFSKTPSFIWPRFLWFNNFIKIANTPFYLKEFSEKKYHSYINQPFTDHEDFNGRILKQNFAFIIAYCINAVAVDALLAVDACYTKKLERYSQIKFGYCNAKI